MIEVVGFGWGDWESTSLVRILARWHDWVESSGTCGDYLTVIVTVTDDL